MFLIHHRNLPAVRMMIRMMARIAFRMVMHILVHMKLLMIHKPVVGDFHPSGYNHDNHQQNGEKCPVCTA